MEELRLSSSSFSIISWAVTSVSVALFSSWLAEKYISLEEALDVGCSNFSNNPGVFLERALIFLGINQKKKGSECDSYGDKCCKTIEDTGILFKGKCSKELGVTRRGDHSECELIAGPSEANEVKNVAKHRQNKSLPTSKNGQELKVKDLKVKEVMEMEIEEMEDDSGDKSVDLEDLDKISNLHIIAQTETMFNPIVIHDEKSVSMQEPSFEEAGSPGSEDSYTKNTVPGTQKVWVKTYGCSHNRSDSEYMMGLLDSYGYIFVSSMELADICLLNSCTVKNPSQDALISLLIAAKALNKPTVIAGCVPQADRKLEGLDGVSLIGVTQIDRIVEVVEQTLNGNVVRLLSKKRLPQLDLPKIRRNPIIEIVPLGTGCLGACTYCKTKHARGKLGSYDIIAILGRIKRSISEGVKQIWLTSEDTGAYGLDIKTNIAELLLRIVEILPEDVMLRIGMSNPPYMKKHISAIADVLKHPRVFEFLHIPVQSGSNETLSQMVREYTVEDFDFIVDALKEKVPNITIATDIICGFPSEEEVHHQETLDLIRRHKFPVLNISQFYPRPGTKAATMKRVSTKIVKNRSTEVTRLFESYVCFQYLIGTIQQVWFSENSDKSDHTIGHTKQYVKVLVDRDDSLIGFSCWIRVISSFKWHVLGVKCSDPDLEYS